MRHGHSLGNQADAAAREADAEVLELDVRDADVELSPTGIEQADALAAWAAGLDEKRRPTYVVSSPYRRAHETALRTCARLDLEPDVDERLRERDLGAFDGLTVRGIRARHAEESARREKLGKFYYQPPGGESWADVALRIRSILGDLRDSTDDDAHVWLFCHQAVIMGFRYVLEGLTEEEVLELDRTHRIPNVSVTTYLRHGDYFDLDTFADTSAVDDTDAEATAQDEQGSHDDE